MKRFDIWRRLTGTQDGIASVFAALMLLPNILLACTEGYSFTVMSASLLLPAAFYMLLMTVFRRPGVLMLCSLPLMVLGAFQIVLLYLFGGSIIAVDMFTNVFTTNASEAGELLGNIWPAIVFVCVVYLPLLALGVRSCLLPERITPGFRRRMALWGAGFMLAGAAFAGISCFQTARFAVHYHLFPANVFYNIHLALDKWDRSERYPETSADFVFGAVKERPAGEREVYVLVIGEASRAASWSLFGYGRETNPRLEKRAGVVPFARMTTECNATHKSVPLILAPVSAPDFSDIYECKSLIAAFKEAGFRTLFISNQVPNRSLIDYFAGEADRRVDVSPREGELYTDTRCDGEMLPVVREVLAESDSNLLIVMHTYGSHFNYHERYPREFARFTPDVVSAVSYRNRELVVNSYDNSVLYTDYVLDGVIGILDSARVCSALFYAADHGEDLMDDSRRRFLHASPTPTYYQLHVAALSWFSDRYRALFPDKYAAALSHSLSPVTTAAVFHTVTGMASLATAYRKPELSLVDSLYAPGKRLYLNDHDRAVDFSEAGLEQEDFRMFDSLHIQYDE